MKNYFTGFFTAMCLTGSLFILMGSRSQFHQDIIANSIIVPNSDGSMTILDGNGITTYNDEGKVVSTLGKKMMNRGICCSPTWMAIRCVISAVEAMEEPF